MGQPGSAPNVKQGLLQRTGFTAQTAPLEPIPRRERKNALLVQQDLFLILDLIIEALVNAQNVGQELMKMTGLGA